MKCIVCAYNQNKFIYKKAINDNLASGWKLNKYERHCFDVSRTMFCPRCGNSLMSRTLAQAIIKTYDFQKCYTFYEWVQKSIKLKLAIAEINKCEHLHDYLKKSPYLSYSQFIDSSYTTNIKTLAKRFIYKFTGVKHQDITKLTYRSNSFNLVIHSETLEHVDNVSKALKECRRILKPGGYCLFTVPIILNRNTKRCAVYDNKNKRIKYLKPPTYHGSGKQEDYLVYWEFGKDFITSNELKIIINNSTYLTYVLGFKK